MAIAVFILLVLLVGFVLIIVQSLADSAGVRIRADMVKLLQSYDRIVEAKSSEIRKLQAQAEKLRTPNPAEDGAQTPPPAPVRMGQAPIPRSADYRTDAFGGGYGAIRESFRLGEQERSALIHQVAQAEAQTPPGRGPAAKRLREALSFDTVFQLTQLPGERQLALLDESLDDEGWTLLRDYCQDRGEGPFDTGRFCHWLAELAELESPTLLVREGGTRPPEASGGVYEDGICEGVQIVLGGRLYDYSIQEREIG